MGSPKSHSCIHAFVIKSPEREKSSKCQNKISGDDIGHSLYFLSKNDY